MIEKLFNSDIGVKHCVQYKNINVEREFCSGADFSLVANFVYCLFLRYRFNNKAVALRGTFL